MPPPISLLLVDDHSVMRTGLENMLNANSAFRVVASADDGEAAQRLFRTHQPDVTLLDVMMPGLPGITTLRQLRAEFVAARVLMLSASEAVGDIRQSLEAGACGYVAKTARPKELAAAILDAHAGKRVVSAAMELRLSADPAPALLTPRQMEVLVLLGKGLKNPEIARLLGITRSGAKFHVAAVLEKLGVNDRTSAVARAFERGLLRP